MSTISHAIYPGTFDPLTKGHWDIIERASQLFDFVTIAIAQDSHKQPLLAAEKRARLTEQVVQPLHNVSVTLFSGLLIDFAKIQKSVCLIRGLRSAQDLEFESQLAQMNKQLLPTIETVFLLAKPEHAFISSTLVRELVKLNGDIRPFVPKAIADALMR